MTPYFPLSNPGIVSIPLAFLSAIVATLLTAREEQDPGLADLRLRALTGFETFRKAAVGFISSISSPQEMGLPSLR
ncbi:hypothetical protein ABZY09_41765 [Streptomyces sp. NPDC002928]|uniref:hypothetical protein n=1 Tax=Streptomyces sp. NPDC002928 TaxID=3154440 RepID=UPI0033BEA240